VLQVDVTPIKIIVSIKPDTLWGGEGMHLISSMHKKLTSFGVESCRAAKADDCLRYVRFLLLG
jgi:hypothetical protein